MKLMMDGDGFFFVFFPRPLFQLHPLFKMLQKSHHPTPYSDDFGSLSRFCL